jgi:hypothetical protein
MLLVGVGEGEAQVAQAPLNVVGDVVGEAAGGCGGHRLRLRRPTDAGQASMPASAGPSIGAWPRLGPVECRRCVLAWMDATF